MFPRLLLHLLRAINHLLCALLLHVHSLCLAVPKPAAEPGAPALGGVLRLVHGVGSGVARVAVRALRRVRGARVGVLCGGLVRVERALRVCRGGGRLYARALQLLLARRLCMRA